MDRPPRKRPRAAPRDARPDASTDRGGDRGDRGGTVGIAAATVTVATASGARRRGCEFCIDKIEQPDYKDVTSNAALHHRPRQARTAAQGGHVREAPAQRRGGGKARPRTWRCCRTPRSTSECRGSRAARPASGRPALARTSRLAGRVGCGNESAWRAKRPSRAASRREAERSGGRRAREREQETQREHSLLMGVVGVLALAAVIVGVACIRRVPPAARAVLRVQDTDYDAGEWPAGPHSRCASSPVRSRPREAGAVRRCSIASSATTCCASARRRSSGAVARGGRRTRDSHAARPLAHTADAPKPATPPPLATATTVPTATATAVAGATATAAPTPLPTMTADQRTAYAEGLRDILRAAGLSRAEYEACSRPDCSRSGSRNGSRRRGDERPAVATRACPRGGRGRKPRA